MPESGQLFFFFPEGQEVMLLDAVTLVTALAALAGLVAAVAAPVLRLNSAITRLSTLIDRALRDMEALYDTGVTASYGDRLITLETREEAGK